MNPEQTGPEAIESRITALLLGDLEGSEAAKLRAAIENDPELARLRDRLRQTIELVRTAVAVEPEAATPLSTATQLSGSRRAELFARFKVRLPTGASARRSWSWVVPMAAAAGLTLVLSLLSMSVGSASRLRAERSLPMLSLNGIEPLSTVGTRYDIRTENLEESRGRGGAAPAMMRELDEARPRALALQSPGETDAGKRIREERIRVPQSAAMPAQDAATLPVDSETQGRLVRGYDARGLAELGQAVEQLGRTASSPAPDQLSRYRSALAPSGAQLPAPAPTLPARMPVLAGAEDASVKLREVPRSGGVSSQAWGDYDNDGFVDVFSGVNREAQQTLNLNGMETSAFGADPGNALYGNAGGGGFGEGGFTTPAPQAGGQYFTKAEPESMPASGERYLAFDSNALAVEQKVFDLAGVPEKPRQPEQNGNTDVIPAGVAGPTGESFGVMAPTLGDRPALGRLLAGRAGQAPADAADVQESKLALTELEATRGDALDSLPLERFEEADQLSQSDGLSIAAGTEVGSSLSTSGGIGFAAGYELADRAEPEPRRKALAAPEPQPEVLAAEQPFSTFSLNVSDVSFKLAAASLENGELPDPSTIRTEEFLNAFDYRDPEPVGEAAVALSWERARYPFAHDRELLRLSVRTAARGRAANRPLNLVLLLDNSGSMERADRVRIIREAMRVLSTQIQPQDRVSVVSFARTPRLWVDGLAGTDAPLLPGLVGELAPEGGTNLEEALALAYKTAARHFMIGGVNRVVLLTDGAANLGEVEPQALQSLVETNRLKGLALDCFGIGWEGYNDELLETLSRHGDGRYGFVNTPEDAASGFADQLAGALQIAAANVKVQLEFNPARVTTYRQVGYAKHQLTEEQFRDNTVDAAEIGAAESGNALYLAQVASAGQGPVGVVRARYQDPATGEYHELEWVLPYLGPAPALESASPAMRLAGAASAFAEWLARSPFAGEVTSDRLLPLLEGVPEAFDPDPRPQQLRRMVFQAQILGGSSSN